MREEDAEAALSNRVLVPGTASIGINVGIDWYSKYWTNSILFGILKPRAQP